MVANSKPTKKPATPTSVADVELLMDAIAPRRLACPGDPIGLQAGSRRTPVRKILLALDATSAAVAAAIKGRYDLLLTHHPLFFKGLKNLNEDHNASALAAEIARAKLAVFSAHTNLDAAPGGVNDVLADLAGMAAERRPVEITYREPLLKLAVFVPESHLAQVQEAVCDAGAGTIGEYTECTYRVAGTGSFRPGAGANPYIGSRGEVEEVAEWRLETVLPESAEKSVVRALLEAHPYEEPAYDIFTLRREVLHGIGRTGRLNKPVALKTLARRIKTATGCEGAVLLGADNLQVEKLTVWGGSGVGAGTILATGAQAVICGELSYHEAATLQERGVGMIVLGHGPSEQAVLPRLADNLREGLPGVTVDLSPVLWPSFRSV